jgi:hypothetical protein
VYWRADLSLVEGARERRVTVVVCKNHSSFCCSGFSGGTFVLRGLWQYLEALEVFVSGRSVAGT